MADLVDKAKRLILDFVIDNLKLEFPTNYTDDSQVYWEYTQVNSRADAPYTTLSTDADNSLEFSTFNSYRVETLSGGVKKIYKVEKQFSVMTVKFDFSAMQTSLLSGLQAQNLAHKTARHIRRLLKSDKAVSWFKYSSTDIEMGVQSDMLSSIDYDPEYEDTKANQKYHFSCPFNWQETYETEIDLAMGAKIVEINDEVVDIELDIN